MRAAAGAVVPQRLSPRDWVVPPVAAASGWLGAAALIAVAGFALGVPEPALALALAGLFAACGLWSPPAGVVLLLLLSAFFLGEEFQAYFWLPEVLVYATLSGAAVRFVRTGTRPRFPWAAVFLLFLGSTVISIPLNLRELVWEIRDGTPGTLWEDVWGGHYWTNAYYFRMVLDVASGIGLYLLAANLAWTRRRLQAVALALAGVVTALLALELSIFWRLVPAAGRFLNVWLVGHAAVQPGIFAGPSLNQGYLAHGLVALLPLAVYVAVDHPRWPGRVLGGVTVAVILVSAVLTVQKGVFGLLAFEVLLFLVGAWLLRGGGATRWRLAAAGAGVVVAVVATLVVLAPQRATLTAMFRTWLEIGDPFRSHGLAVTARMFLDHPVLGVGTGRFIRFFADYSSVSGMSYIWSHNLYAQLLAEQGLLGLLAFLALVGAVMHGVVRARPAANDRWLPMAFVAISLLGWLAYGLLHYTFLVRALQLYFWIALGVVTAMSRVTERPARLPRPVVAALVLVLALGLGLQARAALARRGVEAGLYPSELLLDGGSFRWTRGVATLELPVEGDRLRVVLASPGVKGADQEVVLLLGSAVVHRVTPPRGTWVAYDIPVMRPAGDRIRLQIRVAPTLVPRDAGLGEDPRRLGVMLQPLRWRRAGGA